MLGLALDDGGLGGAERGGAALRGDGLYDEIDARLRGRRLGHRRPEHERDGWHENAQHDFLLVRACKHRWFAVALVPGASALLTDPAGGSAFAVTISAPN
jgi:hypothetical protein